MTADRRRQTAISRERGGECNSGPDNKDEEETGK